MHDPILHNDLLASLPEPSIDSHTAWNAMEQLLDDALPVQAPVSRSLFQRDNQLWIWVADLFLLIFSIFLFTIDRTSKEQTAIKIDQEPAHVATLKAKQGKALSSSSSDATISLRNGTISRGDITGTDTIQSEHQYTNKDKHYDFGTAALKKLTPFSNKEVQEARRHTLNRNSNSVTRAVLPHLVSAPSKQKDKFTNSHSKETLQTQHASQLDEQTTGLPERTQSIMGIVLPDLLHHDAGINSLPLISSVSNPAPVKKRKGSSFSFGLQWQAPIPFQGSEQYSTNFRGESAPYQFLLPGIWIEFPLRRKGSLRLEATYGQQVYTGHQQVKDTIVTRVPNDTSAGTKQTALIKVRGFGISLSYKQQLTAHWSVSAGVYYQKLQSALFADRVLRNRDSKLMQETLYNLPVSDNTSIMHSLFDFKTELSYQKGRWSLGTQLSMPLNPVYKDALLTIKPLQGSLFVRWAVR